MATYATRGEKLEDVSVYPESIKATGRRSEKVGDAGNGLSTFWKDCPMTAIRNDPGVGYMIEDDFVDLGLSGAITTIISSGGCGRYLVFADTNGTIAPDAALGGGITLTLSDDDETVSITTKQTPFQITSGYGTLWFEARVKFSTITANEQGWFIGLADSIAQDATHPLTAASALADENLVGFHKPEANTTAFDCSYKANTVAAVEVNSDVGTLIANTYVKLGMKFDTKNNVLSFYIDGALQAAGKTIPNAAGADFPADVTLAPMFALMAKTDDTETATLDWWKCAQLYV
jgi:hypothetical protein